MNMRIKGLLEGLIIGVSAVAVIILTSHNIIAEDITLMYIIGVVFGLVFCGILSHIVKKEDYPISDTPEKKRINHPMDLFCCNNSYWSNSCSALCRRIRYHCKQYADNQNPSCLLYWRNNWCNFNRTNIGFQINTL